MDTHNLKCNGIDSRGKANESRWRKWEHKKARNLRSGDDLKAWRLKEGLLIGEVGELLGLHQTIESPFPRPGGTEETNRKAEGRAHKTVRR